MPAPFKQIKRDQFARLVKVFGFRRKIDAVHMHHTWRPDHSQYDLKDGHRSILGMYLHHTQVNKWQDIAQHITIAPDGSIWLGRNWNLPPASAAGHNGNTAFGPFMFEIIGDFDVGRDKLEGEQRQTVIEVIAQIQKCFNPPAESLRFHNSMSARSCPGTSLDRDEILGEVQALRVTLNQSRGAAPPDARGRPFPDDAEATTEIIQQALAWFGRDIPRYTDPAEAEPDYDRTERNPAPETLDAGARGTELTAAMLSALRPHLVNLNRGKFSGDGDWKTDQGEVDAIFDRYLEIALEQAGHDTRPLRVVFFAHGGLVTESAGLETAHRHLRWWKENGVYPIYFVWETGLFDALGEILSRWQQGSRNIFSDRVFDPLIESFVHTAGGVAAWGAMKSSAELAAAMPNSPHGEGGAHYVAAKLKAFCERNSGKAIELHAVGHSAGSIFHAHFLAAARALDVPSFKTAHFLAPAIRVDLFKKRLSGLVGKGKGIDHLSVFTMCRDLERDDNCAMIYSKSLLYLIHHGLEPERDAPVLGLEQSLRRDPDLQALFGLNSPHLGDAQVIFSRSDSEEGKSASLSTTHGGFDDVATMNSVLRRILDLNDTDPITASYPRPAPGARQFDPWIAQVDRPQRINAGTPTAFSQPALSTQLSHAPASGRRRALCVGINQYPDRPLAGCVADAEEWARTLSQLGFEITLMRDSEATRDALVRTLSEMIASSTPGDVIVFQFAGHGTRFADLDHDEDEDDATDEAMIPFDYAGGGYLIDDDVREIFTGIPDGVNVTCFFDCCHSGSNTRFGIGSDAAAVTGPRDERRRLLPATAEMKAAHERFRGQSAGSRSVRPASRQAMKNVAFSACHSGEYAYESDGHGDFTARATRILRAGIDGLSNEQFGSRVLAEFGAGSRQRPLLDCAGVAGARGLLASLTGSVQPSSTGDASLSPASRADLKSALQALIQRL